MNEFAVYSPRKFISFRHLVVDSSAHKLPEERESENPQNVAERKEANTYEIGETFTSRAKSPSSLQDAPVRAECIGAKLGDEDHDLTIAEEDCVLTSSCENVEDLSAFVTERLLCLSEGGVGELILDVSVNVEEVLCGNVVVEEDGGENRQSM